MTRNECIEILKLAGPYIKEKYGVKSLSLFGSTARGTHTDESDVDLFIDMPPKAFQLVELGYYLEDILGRAVDLVRSSQHLNQVFLKEIERDGITIF